MLILFPAFPVCKSSDIVSPTINEEGRNCVPYINIKVTPEGLTTEKKQRVIAGVTKVLQDELGKNPATTVVVIDEVSTDNWGIHGRSVTAIRKGT